jgi:hypothetical protein
MALRRKAGGGSGHMDGSRDHPGPFLSVIRNNTLSTASNATPAYLLQTTAS